jgi:NAD(P)H-dependent FMN reductase
VELEILRTELIYGSARDGRFCDRVANWAADSVAGTDGFSLDRIDPRVLNVPPWQVGGDGPEVAEFRNRIEGADAFIVVTPEYNHGYPAALKFVIDLAHAEWRAKPIAFVSYGGISGGLRAVEQLRLVFAELHATTIRDSVSFANPWDKFDGTGKLIDPEESERAMGIMLAHLKWWATALRQARKAAPYKDIVTISSP